MVGLSNDRSAGDSAIRYTKKSFDAATKAAAHADRQSGRLSCGSTGVPSCLISAEQLWELSHVDVFAFKKRIVKGIQGHFFLDAPARGTQ